MNLEYMERWSYKKLENLVSDWDYELLFKTEFQEDLNDLIEKHCKKMLEGNTFWELAIKHLTDEYGFDYITQKEDMRNKIDEKIRLMSLMWKESYALHFNHFLDTKSEHNFELFENLSESSEYEQLELNFNGTY